jgi:hypothetical protein
MFFPVHCPIQNMYSLVIPKKPRRDSPVFCFTHMVSEPLGGFLWAILLFVLPPFTLGS